MTDDTTPEPPRPRVQPTAARAPVRRSAEAKPQPDRTLKIVRFLAAESEKVIFGSHAQERMYERGISDSEVLTVLRTGMLKGPILAGINAGEWKCKVVAKPRGSRQMGVVTIILLDEHLFVKTVEWEDK